MPVSAMHDDDLIYFDLIQVTKPSTCNAFTRLFRAAPAQTRRQSRQARLPGLPRKVRAQSPFGEIEPVEAI
jgi:hypothetical protein